MTVRTGASDLVSTEARPAHTTTGGPEETSGRPGTAGGGLTRRRLGARLLALGGVLVLHAAFPGVPGAAGAAGSPGAPGSPAERRALQGLRLRYGSARQAGLLEKHLEGVADEARRFLGPSPEHPYYAGAVVLAGRGRTIALHRAMGHAVRYADYDGRTDRVREFPEAERIAMAEDTVFDLASLTKLFTSILAVQQIERGRWSWRPRCAGTCRSSPGAARRSSRSVSCSRTPRVCVPGRPSTRSPRARGS